MPPSPATSSDAATTECCRDLPPEIETRCLNLSTALDLPLAGIDLLRDADGRWWCFEVNPSPAYSCFSEPTGLPMAESLARWLGGCEPS